MSISGIRLTGDPRIGEVILHNFDPGYQTVVAKEVRNDKLWLCIVKERLFMDEREMSKKDKWIMWNPKAWRIVREVE